MKLIFLRHGSYLFNEHLSEKGKSEIIAKIPIIKEIVGESRNVKLFASDADRTIESMQLIADELQLPFTPENALSGPTNWNWCKKTIKSAKKDDTTAIIYLVHVQTISTISSTFVKELGIDNKKILCLAAEGIVLDLDAKTMKKI